METAVREGAARQRGTRIVGERQWHDKTYQLVSVRCGKEGCRCARGQPHGPYWYAYWSEGGKTRCQYVGKTTPWSKFYAGEIDWQGNPITP